MADIAQQISGTDEQRDSLLNDRGFPSKPLSATTRGHWAGTSFSPPLPQRTQPSFHGKLFEQQIKFPPVFGAILRFKHLPRHSRTENFAIAHPAATPAVQDFSTCSQASLSTCPRSCSSTFSTSHSSRSLGLTCAEEHAGISFCAGAIASRPASYGPLSIFISFPNRSHQFNCRYTPLQTLTTPLIIETSSEH